jgi:histidinol dehydrogenase
VELGIKKIFQVGGAQAIAALAFGTQTIPKVDKIVGPGNTYVTTAKKMLFGTVGIDHLAGPSEILILADQSANPTFIAYDLTAQAEHDENAFCVLITDSSSLIKQVLKELKIIIPKLKRRKIISSALKKNGAIILIKNIKQAAPLINTIAPEHVALQTKDLSILSKIKNAGCVFIGQYSPVALGDYFVGTNHVLPTSGTARFSSPLSVFDFVKAKSTVNYSKISLKKAAADTAKLAEIEGLEAHRESVLVRILSP